MDHGYDAYPSACVSNTTRTNTMTSITTPLPDYVGQSGPATFHWWLWDTWPGYLTPYGTDVGTTTVSLPPYPAVWALGYHNSTAGHGVYDFQGVYSNNAFMGSSWPADCLEDPTYWLGWLPLYTIIMNNIDGTCVGMAGESLEFYNGYEDCNSYDTNVFYPSGFRVCDGENIYTHPSCGPDCPIDLWAHVVVNHGVQLTTSFIGTACAQMSLASSGVRGDPRNCLSALRSALNASNIWSILDLKPSLGTGHVLVPYAIQDVPGGHSHIMVYDCNKEYHAEEDPGNGNNISSTTAYVDIDTNANTYTYTMADGTNWSGTGIYVIPLDVWLGDRHAPIWEEAAASMFAALVVCGNADAQYTAPDGSQLGWTATGAPVDTMTNGVPFDVIGSTRTNHNTFLIIQSNLYPSLTIQVNVRQDGHYLFHTSDLCRILQLEVLNAHGGDTEMLGVGCTNQVTNQVINSFTYAPTRSDEVFWPKAAVCLGGKDSAVFRWYGLNPGVGGKVQIRTLPDARSVDLVNDSSTILSPFVVVAWADSTNAIAGTNAFTPPPIPPGALQRLTLAQWPSAQVLLCGMDTNGDGVIDSSQSIQGTNFNNQPPVPGANTIVLTENTTTNILTSQLLVSATDPDGDPLSIPSVVNLTQSGGSATLAGGSITYVPPTSYTGLDAIYYTLADPYQTVQGVVTVTVNAINNQPPTLPCQTNVIKYMQMPNLQNGMDVLACTNGTLPPIVLADDFVCTNIGPISDIHLWCSWLGDNIDLSAPIWLAIYDDVPATNNQPSHPGNLVWSQWFGPNDYVQNLYTTGFESFYDPSTSTTLGTDTNMYYYCFSLFPTNRFVQTGTAASPQTNWLAVYAAPSGNAGSRFGWKTSAVQQNDAAAWSPGWPPTAAWQPVLDTNNFPLDFAFVINTATNCQQPVLLCSNQTVVCGATWTFDPPGIVDPCCGTNGVPTLVSITSSGSCPWVIQANWAYTNCLGSIGSGVQTILVMATNAPVLMVPDGGDLGLNPTVPDDAAMLSQVAVNAACGMLLTNVTHVDGSNGSIFSRTFTILAKDILLQSGDDQRDLYVGSR